MIRPSSSGQQPERMLSDPKPVLYRKLRRKPHPRLVVFGLALVVDGQPAALAEPGEGALYDPAAGQDLKVVDALAFADDLDRQREDLGGPGDQLASVAGVGPDQPEGREVGA
jgi:hypothetical protein